MKIVGTAGTNHLKTIGEAYITLTFEGERVESHAGIPIIVSVCATSDTNTWEIVLTNTQHGSGVSWEIQDLMTWFSELTDIENIHLTIGGK